MMRRASRGITLISDQRLSRRPRANLHEAPTCGCALAARTRLVGTEHGGEEYALEEFLRVCAMLVDRAVAVEGKLLWPNRVAVPKYRLGPAACSALAQGQAASVLIRAHLATGEGCACSATVVRAVL